MYLKSIKIDGFKSFAEKTVFEFKRGITAIVGPNGSGKSNIVDAIRWVLGEQSVKSLRGASSMSDVIFAGSLYKEALNKAAVTLTFDNSDNYLHSEFKEIEVKRIVYKNGENEYYINNSKVRLKDITDLFIDSGSSSDAFNIISQGTVTDIVNSKPIERRLIFENAAGVLKYKKRKEESLKKMAKASDNLDSVNLVIEELQTSLEPLKKQASIATQYLELKDNLKNIECALITKDITELNKEYNAFLAKEKELTLKLEGMNTSSNTEELEKIKLDIYKVDDEINILNKKLISLTEEIAHLDSEKRITVERCKYEYSDDKIKNNLINLKEEELNIIKEIEVVNNEIDLLNKEIKEKNELNNNYVFENNSNNLKITSYEEELNDLVKEKLVKENQINITEANILNNEGLPLSVKNILNNTRLTGIHNTLGNLINVRDEYGLCLDVVLGNAKNFLIVDNEEAAKMAINYLKEKQIGRATFLPLNIIKSRYIDVNTKERLISINGYVGLLSDLIEYDKKYQNIMENQLGNVIVAKDIDSMNVIARIMEYKYRVVALDGSIIYAGGSISGGNNKKNNFNNLRGELEKLKNSYNNIQDRITNLENNLKELNNDKEIINKKILELKEVIVSKEMLRVNKMNLLATKEEQLKVIKNDIQGINALQTNSLDQTLTNIMTKLNNLNIEKEKLEQNLQSLKDTKDDLNNHLSELENISNKINAEYKIVANELNNASVNVGKLNVKLDNLLLTLNEEYNMTYEYAQNHFVLDIEESLARANVQKIKQDIKSLGEVNTGSIEEYKRINERYEFLTNQKNDLETSITGLKTIISDMDNIMTERFKTTFAAIAQEFSKVFKIMFQGGVGKLELTDPNDYLNTGIEMIVIPPGKKLHNTQSLSGGEKSLTAICLLFAILNVAPVPFIVLDEVEAALDEVNVDLFGEYLNKKKLDSQYILITHKKRMMEYADVLYGITMQNAGISKVVGVELQNI